MRGSSILRDGAPYLPTGITIFGLAGGPSPSGLASDLADIGSIASFWHANTVRIQVAPPALLDDEAGYGAAIEEEVHTAEADGLNVVIAAQYQRVGRIAGPNSSTLQFWQMLAPMFAGDPRVWFDLFNEPDLTSWPQWRDGGGGLVGMQSLVDAIRAVAPRNLILAEGLQLAQTLQGLQGWELSGDDIVYSVHPYFFAGSNTPQDWDADFGALSATVPVLAGEWGQYDERKNECDPDAPTLVPQFLSYLAAHHIGLIAWALEPGVLIRGDDLEDPTRFDPGVPYTCTGGLDPGPDAQGAGEDVLSFFQSY